MTMRELLANARAAPSAGWGELLLGCPVEELRAPVMLRRADPPRLAVLTGLLAPAEEAELQQRPLLLAVADVASARVVSMRVVRFSGDVLSHAVDGVFESTPEGLAACGPLVSGLGAARHLGGTAPAWQATIRADDVRAARDQARSVTVGRVLAHPTSADGDIRAALRAHDVRAAIDVVRRHPQDRESAQGLGAALRTQGWAADVDIVTLDLGDSVRDDVASALDGLVVIGVRTEAQAPPAPGVEAVGEPADGLLESRLVLVPASPTASALLRRHRRLARAVTAYVVPPLGKGPDDPRHRRELRAALAEVGATVIGSAAPTTGP